MHHVGKTAWQQIEALTTGQITAAALLEETIAHAESIADRLNPFALTLYDRAREQAERADHQRQHGKAGPLCGLPITIKDSQFLAGYPCANGSRSLHDFVPEESCRAVQLLEQAGAVIFAKTTCPELSLTGITHSELHGITSNPWNVERTSGGSSGGSAAAVAAGAGALSLGGDGGGSIRIPAGFCGVVGFKPSFGLVPREPCFPSWQSLVSYGPIGRSVADARLMFSVLNPNAKPYEPAADALHALTDYPLIASEDLGFAPLDDDVRQAFRRVIADLSSVGATIVDDHPGLPSSIVTWAVTASFDAAQHAQEDHAVGEAARDFIEFGQSFSHKDYQEAQQYRSVIHEAYQSLFARSGAHILLTPTIGCEAFPHGTRHPERIADTPIELPWLDWAGFLYDANLAGFPACAIPMGIGDEGMPLSLQILGLPGADDEVLRVAQAIESIIGWDSSIVLPSEQDVIGQ